MHALDGRGRPWPGNSHQRVGTGRVFGAGLLSAQARGQTPRAAKGRRPQSRPGRGSGSSEFESHSHCALVLASSAFGPSDVSSRQLAAHCALPAATMPVTEKDLAEDAPWKKIQQNTFTRWCNEHLKCVNKRIGNLQTDLSDGLRLIALLEVLSQKRMYRKYHQRPTFRQMQLENVSVALEFLDRESIKLVSIGECPGPLGSGWCTIPPPRVRSCGRLGLPAAHPHYAQQPQAGCACRGRGASSSGTVGAQGA